MGKNAKQNSLATTYVLKFLKLKERQKCSIKFLSSILRADIAQTTSITDTLTKNLSNNLSTNVAQIRSTAERGQKKFLVTT